MNVVFLTRIAKKMYLNNDDERIYAVRRKCKRVRKEVVMA